MRVRPFLHFWEHVPVLPKSVASHPSMGLLYDKRQPSGTESSVISWKLDRLSDVLPTLIVAAVAADAKTKSSTKRR